MRLIGLGSPRSLIYHLAQSQERDFVHDNFVQLYVHQLSMYVHTIRGVYFGLEEADSTIDREPKEFGILKPSRKEKLASHRLSLGREKLSSQIGHSGHWTHMRWQNAL